MDHGEHVRRRYRLRLSGQPPQRQSRLLLQPAQGTRGPPLRPADSQRSRIRAASREPGLGSLHRIRRQHHVGQPHPRPTLFGRRELHLLAPPDPPSVQSPIQELLGRIRQLRMGALQQHHVGIQIRRTVRLVGGNQQLPDRYRRQEQFHAAPRRHPLQGPQRRRNHQRHGQASHRLCRRHAAQPQLRTEPLARMERNRHVVRLHGRRVRNLPCRLRDEQAFLGRRQHGRIRIGESVETLRHHRSPESAHPGRVPDGPGRQLQPQQLLGQ